QESLPNDGDVERLSGRLQAAVREHLLGADEACSVAELHARGRGGVIVVLCARLPLDLIEQIFEHGAIALEADGVHVREIVRDRLEPCVLGLDAGLADPQRGIHRSATPIYMCGLPASGPPIRAPTDCRRPPWHRLRDTASSGSRIRDS